MPASCAPLSCATFYLCTTTDVTAIAGSVLWVGLVEHICISDEHMWHLECKLLLCKPSPAWREPEQQENLAQRHHKEAWLCWERLHACGALDPACGTQPHQRQCDPFHLGVWNTDEMPERNDQKTEQKTVGLNSRLLVKKDPKCFLNSLDQALLLPKEAEIAEQTDGWSMAL